jgi:hypothetical protein
MAKYFCTCRFCGQLFACSNPNEDDCGRHGVPRAGQPEIAWTSG